MECKKCGQTFEDSFNSCPNCGENVNGKSNSKKSIFRKWWFRLIIVLVLGVIIGSSGGGNKTETTTVADSEQTTDDSLSATLSTGRSGNCNVYFEVPEDAEKIEIEYEVNFWSGKKAIFLVELP